MSRLDDILTDFRINSDGTFVGGDAPAYKKAIHEIKVVLRELVGASDTPDWDYEFDMCNTCDFQPTDNTQKCLCVYRNELRDSIKLQISKM